jgi:phosphoglycolate phosphatase/pyrophosphatase PpaX
VLKYKCLVLDHDDTVVKSEKTLGFPYFKELMSRIRPNVELTFEDYVKGCHEMPFAQMCRSKWQFTDEELQVEWDGWKAYILTHIPDAYEGMETIIRRQKENGGLVCVVSLSGAQSITRDYKTHFGIEPDAIYGWDLPKELQKPNPYPLLDIMERYDLKPQDLLVVDDMKHGCLMAKEAGVAIGFSAWSKTDFPELSAQMRTLCDFVFETPQKLEEFLFG